MKLLVLFALVALAAAAPTETEVTVVEQTNEMAPNGEFSNSYQLSNGVNQASRGTLKSVIDEENKQREVLVFEGEYVLPGTDGKYVPVKYFADENGTKVISDALPVAPVA